MLSTFFSRPIKINLQTKLFSKFYTVELAPPPVERLTRLHTIVCCELYFIYTVWLFEALHYSGPVRYA
jgi:hypothetical protein